MGLLLGSWMPQLGIKTQVGDQMSVGGLTHRVKQLQGSKTTVTDKDQLRVAGKIVRKYTLSRYPFKFMKLPCKIALFSTESSFQTAQ
jgi:hypothetical protein